MRLPSHLLILITLFCLSPTLVTAESEQYESLNGQESSDPVDESAVLPSAHVHSVKFEGAYLTRTDQLVLSQGKRAQTVTVQIAGTTNSLLDSIVSNQVDIASEEGTVVCVEALPENPQICLKFEIKSEKNIKSLVLKTILNFESFISQPDRTYRTIETPNFINFVTPSIFYTSDFIDTSLKHQFSISANTVDSKGPIECEYSHEKVPETIQGSFETWDQLIAYENLVKTITFSTFSNYAKFSYSGNVKSLRLADTVASTRLQQDIYEQKHQGRYVHALQFTPQYTCDRPYFSDSVGKNYYSSYNLNTLVYTLRYTLFSNWKSDFMVDYFVNLKSLLSSSANDKSKILRVTSGEKSSQNFAIVGDVTTVINLPEGSTLKQLKAPLAHKVSVEEISGIVAPYMKIVILTKQSVKAKIYVQYSDSENIYKNLFLFSLKFFLPFVGLITFFSKIEWSIENSKELDSQKALKRDLAKLKAKTKTYTTMTQSFQSILEHYKVNKNMEVLEGAYALFKEKCTQYLNTELAPCIAQCQNTELTQLIEQITEAHQQHIDALALFHQQKIDRVNYIKQREVINNVIEQSLNQIQLSVKN